MGVDKHVVCRCILFTFVAFIEYDSSKVVSGVRESRLFARFVYNKVWERFVLRLHGLLVDLRANNFSIYRVGKVGIWMVVDALLTSSSGARIASTQFLCRNGLGSCWSNLYG